MHTHAVYFLRIILHTFLFANKNKLLFDVVITDENLTHYPVLCIAISMYLYIQIRNNKNIRSIWPWSLKNFSCICSYGNYHLLIVCRSSFLFSRIYGALRIWSKIFPWIKPSLWFPWFGALQYCLLLSLLIEEFLMTGKGKRPSENINISLCVSISMPVLMNRPVTQIRITGQMPLQHSYVCIYSCKIDSVW